MKSGWTTKSLITFAAVCRTTGVGAAQAPTPARDGIVNEDWTLIHGGDGFYAQLDNVEPWIVYTESQDGYLARRNLRTAQGTLYQARRKVWRTALSFSVEFTGGRFGSRPQHHLLRWKLFV